MTISTAPATPAQGTLAGGTAARHPNDLVGDDDQRLLATGLPDLLAAFHTAGVLGLADVHTATAVGRMAAEADERVLLAAALVVRALREGSVCLDLLHAHEGVFDEAEETIDVSGLPWPEPESWLELCRKSPLVTASDLAEGQRPLRLAYGLLYLERYWRQEEQVRLELLGRRSRPLPQVDQQSLTTALDRLFTGEGLEAGEPDWQRVAAAVSSLSWVTVLAGGPGTGKTTTIAKVLAILADQPGRRPQVALAAPTGKAAARLAEAVRSAQATMSAADQELIGPIVNAPTLHRLLGWQPRTPGRFRHHRRNPLPHDVIIVDEVSMVSMTMMARLLEAVRPDARLILVGDPDQLTSVEAGAVLADVTRAEGPADDRLVSGLASLGLPADATFSGGSPGRGVVVLSRNWRFGTSIRALAEAIRRSDPDSALAVLRQGDPAVGLAEVDVENLPAESARQLAALVRSTGGRAHRSAVAGEVAEALAAMDSHRVLCAHRRGPYGVSRWGEQIEQWLAESIVGYGEEGEWYRGRPLLITTNDYELNLYNGDTGIVVETPNGPQAAFGQPSDPRFFTAARLDAVQTVHAMTVHRAQGSQFERISFILPPTESALLTRELVYTAVTRASESVTVYGSAEAFRRAVLRPANRASGLRTRL